MKHLSMCMLMQLSTQNALESNYPNMHCTPQQVKSDLLYTNYFTHDHNMTFVNCILRLKPLGSLKWRSQGSSHSKLVFDLMIPVTADCLHWAVSVQLASNLWKIRVLKFCLQVRFLKLGKSWAICQRIWLPQKKINACPMPFPNVVINLYCFIHLSGFLSTHPGVFSIGWLYKNETSFPSQRYFI